MTAHVFHQPADRVLHVARRFSHKADRYDEISCIQRRSASRLCAMIESSHLDWHSLLDIGCGTGASLFSFVQKHADRRFFLNDIAENMLHMSRQRMSSIPDLDVRYLKGDANVIDLPSADILYANFSLQWLPDAMQFLHKNHAKYKHLVVSILLEGTFSEWYALCEQYGLSPAQMRYPSLAEVLLFMREICTHYECIVYKESLSFRSVYSAMRYISDLGASYSAGDVDISNLRRFLNHTPSYIKLNYHIAHFVSL